jgi:biofilm PGA synthesis N-glycosyltransferase PgaC
MSITALVPAWNEAASIEMTIRSLQAQTYPISKIIVIDDCSEDGTGVIARALGVTVLRPVQNLKKAGAQNFGLEHVTTDLFVTVDADTVLAPDALYEAMRFFNEASTEVVCGTVIPQKITTFWEHGRLIDYLYAQTIMKPAQNHNGLVLVASGCFSIFRTQTVRKYGGLDHRTIAEDMDLTWRIHEDGGRVYFASKAICYPVEPPTFEMYFNQLDRWYRGFMQNVKVRNFRIFPRKKAMGVLVYVYLLWFAVSALFTPVFLFGVTGDIAATLLWTAVLNGIFVWIPALYAGTRMGIPYGTILIGFVPYLAIPYINMYIYIQAAWKELVVGEKLTQWKKGH